MLKINSKFIIFIKSLTYTLLFFSILTKLIYIKYIETKFLLLGISEFSNLFGLIELTATLIYIYSRTHGLGFSLLCAYFGGAIAIDLQCLKYLYQPFLMLSLIFINTFIKRPSFFCNHFSIDRRPCCVIIKFRN